MSSQNPEPRPIRSRSERRTQEVSGPETPVPDSGPSPVSSSPDPSQVHPSNSRGRRRIRRKRVSKDGFLSFSCDFTESTYYALKVAADDRELYGYEICEIAVAKWLKDNQYIVDTDPTS